jgi:hypothetical protein
VPVSPEISFLIGPKKPTNSLTPANSPESNGVAEVFEKLLR